MSISTISIGLPGATPAAAIAELAPRIEQAGFRGLWLNDTPTGDALAGLAVAAGVTTTLRLGAGVIPVDRRPASEIAFAARSLPAERLVLGIGSGAAAKGLALVSEAVAELREATAASVAVGALGPRMRRLAARAADGLLLNWLTPAAAAGAMDDLRREAGDRAVQGILYARTAVDADALPALRAEAARYAGFPAYAANFARIGAEAIDTTIDGTRAQPLREQLAAYTGVVDELVLRVITAEPDAASVLRFIDRIVAEA